MSQADSICKSQSCIIAFSGPLTSVSFQNISFNTTSLQTSWTLTGQILFCWAFSFWLVFLAESFSGYKWSHILHINTCFFIRAYMKLIDICLQTIQIKLGNFFVLDYIWNDLYSKHLRIWIQNKFILKFHWIHHLFYIKTSFPIEFWKLVLSFV